MMDILVQTLTQTHDILVENLLSPSFEALVGSVVIKSSLLGVGSALVYGVYCAVGLLTLPTVKMKGSSADSVSASSDKRAPKHVAVIMDGNRRFGKKAHSDPLKGHWSGGQTLVDFVQWCIDDGVEVLTVYAFSTENWSRDIMEVNTLMVIISKYAKSFQKEALTRNVKVNVLCTDKSQLPNHVKESIDDLESSTSHCDGFVFNICLSYGGRADIVSACQMLVDEVSSGKIAASDITEDYFGSKLLTKDLPPPDMLIRTSGECRISNFLLWQIAYSELFFVKKLWPEVTQQDLRELFDEYRKRTRRFGV